MILTSLSNKATFFVPVIALILTSSLVAFTQGLGSGTVEGVAVDPNSAVVPNASVTISNPVSGYTRSAVTSQDGTFRFDNLPPNNYQLTVSATGFTAFAQNISVRTSVPISLRLALTVGAAAESVTITGATSDVLENIPSAHVDVDKSLIDRLPVEIQVAD